jgi:hypothetical protein
MTTSKRQTLADFMYYSLCAGQAKAGPYGYSPLPLNLVQAGFQQLAKLKKADPAVDLANRDVTKCNNPTFVAGNLSENHLAQIAPQPAACDKLGAGPCGTATGTNTPSTDESGGGGGGGTGASAPTTAPGTGPAEKAGKAGGGAPGESGPAGGGKIDPGLIDPETGAVIGDGENVTSAGDAIFANPTELAADRTVDGRTFGWLAAVELLALVLLPGLYVALLRRRRSVKAGGRL